MPKARNSKVDEALALYRQGVKLIEISRRLEVPEGTVRRWKCTYDWMAKRANARRRKNRTLANVAANLAIKTPPALLGIRTPRSSASCPSTCRGRRWSCCISQPTPLLWIFSGLRSSWPMRPSSGPRKSPTSKTPKTRPSRRSRTAAAPSHGVRSGKSSRPGTSRPTL